MVASALARRGAEVFRLDTDRFPGELRLAARHSQGGRKSFEIIDGSARIDLTSIDAVWYRRIDIGRRLPDEMDSQVRSASLLEANASLKGVLASLDAFFLDPPASIRAAEAKQLQLELAAEAGLDTPRTLTTNDVDEVRKFSAACGGDIVTKMLSSFAIYDPQGEEQVVFTSPIVADELDERLAGLHLCPMTFQERLHKQLELRVTVVGNQVFAASIDSQRSERTRHDWRADGIGLIDKWRPYQLPGDVEQNLLALLTRLRLNYGACDFILTPAGRLVFLEVNPGGEFFWLVRAPGLPIHEAIADVLAGTDRRV